MELTTFGVSGKIPFPKGFPQPFFIPQKSFPEFSPDFPQGYHKGFPQKSEIVPFLFGWRPFRPHTVENNRIDFSPRVG
jgi:hypothetical protein